MKRIVSMKTGVNTLFLETRVYADIRVAERETVLRLISDGVTRVERQSPYMANGQSVEVRSRLELIPAFSLEGVNVRVVDKPYVRRHGPLCLFNNVSRAYPDARRRGLFKLIRFVMRFPDVVINLGGRSLANAADYELMCSVVAHEFAHVWGCGDQYKLMNDKKRRADVAENDLMYRTGASQRLQDYHIAKLWSFAKKGKLPLRKIV